MSFRRLPLPAILTLLFFIMVPTVTSFAWAADTPGDPWAGTPPPGGETSLLGLLFRVALSLGFIVFLIWAAVWVMRRFSDVGNRTSGTGGLVEVLARSYIAPKKAVYVLRVGDRALAVGVTESSITPLADLDLAETLASCSEGAPSREGLSELLGGFRSRMSRERK